MASALGEKGSIQEPSDIRLLSILMLCKGSELSNSFKNSNEKNIYV